MDKVLQRLKLENRKNILKTIRIQANYNNIIIACKRGTYELKYDARIAIINDIDREIKDIDIKLEELTGLNQDKIKRLYEV